MSDEIKQQEGDLLQGTSEADSIAEAAADTDETKEDPSGEQGLEGISLEDGETEEPKDDAPQKGEEQKLKQVKRWQDKIDRGEKSLEDLTKDTAWMKAYLKPKQETDKEAIRQVLKEEREEAQAESLKQQLEDAHLPSLKVALINQKYKFFRSKGLSKLDSIEAAKEIAQVDVQVERSEAKMRTMSIPKPSGKSTSQDYRQIYESVPFAQAQKMIPAKQLDEIMRSRAR